MALGVVAFGIVVIFGKEAFAMKGAARRKMIVAFILMLEAVSSSCCTARCQRH